MDCINLLFGPYYQKYERFTGYIYIANSAGKVESKKLNEKYLIMPFNYGKYSGTARYHMDQIPADFSLYDKSSYNAFNFRVFIFFQI